MNMKRKCIIGILIVLLLLSLVMCSMFERTNKDSYEGEEVPIEAAEDIYDDEQEAGTSESDENEISNSKSDIDESNGAENITGEDSAEENDTNESNHSANDKKDEQKDEQKDDDNNIEEGWSPFY